MAQGKKKTAVEKSESELLADCFHCLSEKGLEKTTMRDFYQSTGLGISSFYWRFSGKDEVVIEATYRGLRDITAALFCVAVQNLNSLSQLLDRFKEAADGYIKDIRLIYQVASSPVYGDALREKAKGLSSYYREITELIAKKINRPADALFPYVTLFIATIREYVIWEDEAITGNNIRRIYEGAMALPQTECPCKQQK